MKVYLFHKTATEGQTNERTAKNYRTYRYYLLRGDLKNLLINLSKSALHLSEVGLRNSLMKLIVKALTRLK